MPQLGVILRVSREQSSGIRLINLLTSLPQNILLLLKICSGKSDPSSSVGSGSGKDY